MAFSWLRMAATALTFKTLLRHHAKRELTTVSRCEIGSPTQKRKSYRGGQVGVLKPSVSYDNCVGAFSVIVKTDCETTPDPINMPPPCLTSAGRAPHRPPPPGTAPDLATAKRAATARHCRYLCKWAMLMLMVFVQLS